jgi:transcriptional regulator with XRE-family HTH domain
VDEVRRLRLEKGWSQNELAYHAKLAPSVISLIETGKRDPNATTLRKLAGALEVRIPDLFEDSGSGKAQRRSSRQAPLLDGLEDERRTYQAVSEALMTTVDRLASTEPPRSLDDVVKRFGIVEVLYGVFEALDERGRSARPVLFRVATQLLEQNNEYLKHRREDSEASREAEAARERMREWNRRLGA